MDAESQRIFARIIRTQRIAALGTLRDGAPFVSMILFAAAPDFSSFYIHASRLAHHTQDILRDPRVSLMIAEPDANAPDPQQLARVSINGEAVAILPTATDCDQAKALYLEKFPQATFNFTLKDFSIYRIQPRSARYVAGFGKIFDLTTRDLKHAAEIK